MTPDERDAAVTNETWNTCPDCFRKWKDAVATAGLVHRTKLCVTCVGLHEGLASGMSNPFRRAGGYDGDAD